MAKPVHLVTQCESARIDLLEHWLHHHRPQVDGQCIVLHHGDEHTRFARLCRDHRCEYRRTTGVYDSMRMMRELTAWLWLSPARPGDWVVHLDSDEFLVDQIEHLAAEAEGQRADWVAGWMRDRHAADGALVPIPRWGHDPSLSDTFPLKSKVTADLARAEHWKAILQKLGEHVLGNHSAHGNRHHRIVPIDHYKWHAGVVQRLEERRSLEKHRNRPWWVESDRLLNHINAHGGSIDLSPFALP